MDTHVIATRALLSCRQAVLATHSSQVPGFPMTSVIPVGIHPNGNVITLISELALHTRNLILDSRVSVLLHDDQEQNWQASTRLSVLGNLQPLDRDDPQLDYLRQSYYRIHPELKDFDQDLDFHFWQLIPLRYRLISGFAQVRWLDHIEPRLFLLQPDDYAALESLLPHQGSPMRIIHASHFGLQILQNGRIRFLNLSQPASSLAGVAAALRTGAYQDHFFEH